MTSILNGSNVHCRLYSKVSCVGNTKVSGREINWSKLNSSIISWRCGKETWNFFQVQTRGYLNFHVQAFKNINFTDEPLSFFNKNARDPTNPGFRVLCNFTIIYIFFPWLGFSALLFLLFCRNRLRRPDPSYYYYYYFI